MRDWRLVETVRTSEDAKALLFTVSDGEEQRKLQLSAGELAAIGRPRVEPPDAARR